MTEMRKKLSCQNCGQSYWAYAPADELTKATLESCELPEYDIVQNVECENCHQLFGVYWHNENLEKKRLLEIKELAYLKERYVSFGLGSLQLDHLLAYEDLRVLVGNLLKETRGERAFKKRDEATNEKFRIWLHEFTKQRMEGLDMSPRQRRKFDSEIRTLLDKFAKGYIEYVKPRIVEWQRSKDFAELSATETSPKQESPKALEGA